MSVRERFDGQQSGGFNSYADRVTKRIHFKKDVRTRQKQETIASGQVLLAGTFLERDATSPYHLKVHGSITESTLATFATALTVGQTLIVAGITFTSGASGTTAAQLITAFGNNGLGIASGATAASLTGVTNAKNGGTFTAGTLTDYNSETVDADTVVFNAATSAAAATDIAFTGTGAAPTLVKTEGTATFNKIAGLTMYDVNATSAAVDVEVYSEGSFWADDDGTTFLKWVYDPSEVLVKADGTTVALTAYNTGCAGDSDASNNLKRKFVEGSEFAEIGFINIGDRS